LVAITGRAIDNREAIIRRRGLMQTLNKPLRRTALLAVAAASSLVVRRVR